MKKTLPPIRKDLKLSSAPPLESGFPTWTLHDPVRNRFYCIGWSEFELLSRWRLGNVDRVMTRVNQETTLHVTDKDVHAMQHFLSANDLLAPQDPDVLARLKSGMTQKKENFFTWVLFHYLFIRIPLVHPDRFLDATLPAVRILISPLFLWFTGLAACLSFFLVLRQWDAFIHTFLYFFSLKGLVLYGLAIFFVKICHELGHAYAARHYGVKVPTMGIAFLVFWPMLYTDNSDAWMLKNRSARMIISGAGSLVELGLAMPATLLWHVLADGPLRSACFLVAAVTWIGSLGMNLNPFLRFDGYYLLSDFLNIPNLQNRSFALGKWYLRKMLLRLGHPDPEPRLSRMKKRLLIGYAYATWLYRLILFTAIAVMVYYMFFKALGIFLFGMEMIWFVARPICREMRVWRTLLRQNLGSMRRILLMMTCLFMLVAVPWNSSISVPAILKPGTCTRIYPPLSAQMQTIQVKNRGKVKAGDLLFVLNSPQLELREKRAETQVMTLEEQLRRLLTHSDLIQQSQVIQSQLAKALTELQGCRAQKQRLRITAPTSGTMTDMPDGLRPGTWVRQDQLLALLIAPGPIIEGYLPEASLEAVKPGDSGRFYMENGNPPINCMVRQIDPASSRVLKTPYLASVYGGEIPVMLENDGALISHKSLYRVLLTLDEDIPNDTLPFQIARGSVRIKGKPQSLLCRAWRRMMAVVIRESGF